MRFNKQELVAIASQPSQNFDREGILVLRERQDGFFRRSEGNTAFCMTTSKAKHQNKHSTNNF